jgi:colanic acid/amylovoran biosynthesis protein
MTSPKSVVLLDLWTDANRGDCALQIGLIAMARDKWPDAKIAGIFRFGVNEMNEAAAEVQFTSAELDELCGGLRRTYYSAANYSRLTSPAGKILSLWSFVEAFAFLLLYKLGLAALVPRAKRSVLRRLETADVVVWKGKNFRDYGGLGGINRQFTLLSAGLIASWLNPRLHCVNASVWPMRNAIERMLVRRAFSKCLSISVREPASLDAIKRLGLPKVAVHFAQDLSFYCLRAKYGATGSKRKPVDLEYDVALTVTQWGNSSAQASYLEALRKSVSQLAAAGARKFVVVPQVTRAAEDSSALVAALSDTFAALPQASLAVLKGSPDIGDLLDTYERCGLLIGTRMHSCVFAASVATPFVAIAYDAGPKWDILKEFWPARFVFEYGSAGDAIAGAAVELFRAPTQVVAAASARFGLLAVQSFDNVKHI